MEKKNCWEHMGCGREPGGLNARELGICPASTFMPFYGIHDGTAAGRACWAVAGTMCKGEVSGSYAKKLKDCRDCEFYKLVREQEGNGIILSVDLLCLVEDRVNSRPSGLFPRNTETNRGQYP